MSKKTVTVLRIINAERPDVPLELALPPKTFFGELWAILIKVAFFLLAFISGWLANDIF